MHSSIYGKMPLTGAEVAQHNSQDSCWVIVHGKAYDVTDFLPEHPGGMNVILRHAGADATAAFEPVHPPDTLDKYLDRSKHLGLVDMATVARKEEVVTAEERERRQRVREMPPLEQCYNMLDFEAVARRVMRKAAWAYYSSGADDEIVCLGVVPTTGLGNSNTSIDSTREPRGFPAHLVPAAHLGGRGPSGL